ncbi:MAG: hypothetical protein HZA58_07555, partial [Acidimicrobiia bacterium]|nr:hypothetical protein [Acidimicrobiia bacterium]
AVATMVLAIDTAFGDGGFEGLIFGQFDNVPAGLIALLGAAILLVFGTRFADHAPGAIKRAGSFMLLAAFGLASVAFGFLLYDLDLGDFTPLVRLLPVAAVALYIYFRVPSVPTQLALFATVVQAVSAVLVLIQVEDPVEPTTMILSTAMGGTPDTGGWVTLAVSTALGLAWIWLGFKGFLRTRNTAFVLGAFYAWINAIQLFGTADGWIVLSIAIALGFVWAAATWQSSVLAAFATVAVAVLIAQFVSIATDSPTVTTWELAYGIPGAAAVFGAWWLSRTKPARTAPMAAMPSPAVITAPPLPMVAATPPSTTRKPATAKKPTATKKAASTKKASTTAKKPAATKKAASTKKASNAKKPTAAKKAASPKKKPTR